MDRKTFYVSFFLRRCRTTQGMAPILARIPVNGISQDVYTPCRTPVEKWDLARGRATGCDKLAYEVNAYIDDFRRLAKDYERKGVCSENRIYLAFIALMFKWL